MQITTLPQAAVQKILRQLPTATGKAADAPDHDLVARASGHASRDHVARRTDGTVSYRPTLARAGRDPLKDAERAALLAVINQLQAMPVAATDTATPTAVLQRIGALLPGGAAAMGPLAGTTTRSLSPEIEATLEIVAGSGGLTHATPDDLEAVMELLDDAPELRTAVEDAKGKDEAEWMKLVGSMDRFNFILLLVNMLMKMAAMNREQAAAMVSFAERSIHEMGDRIREGAQEKRRGAIIGMVVGTVIAGAGVGLGAVAAAKNVNSIKRVDGKAQKLSNEAEQLRLEHAKGATTAPAGDQATIHHDTVLRATNKPQQSAEIHAQHLQNMSQNAVITQGGHAITQMSSSSSNVAVSEAEVKAAEKAREQQIHQQNADTGRKVADTSTQQAAKEDENHKAMLQKMQELLQARNDTADQMTRRLS